MSVGSDRRHKARLLDAFHRQLARSRHHRDLIRFEDAVATLLQRIESPPRPEASDLVPPPPGATQMPNFLGKALFDESMRDLLVRISSQPPPDPDLEPWDPNLFWSPEVVHGYRIWELRDNALRGAWTVWKEPTKKARCLGTHAPPPGPIPHDAADCKSPPCGIYALKRPEQLRRQLESMRGPKPVTILIGLVALTGRVIEHEAGYRAGTATLVIGCLVTYSAAEVAWVAEIPKSQIRALFEAPDATRERLSASQSAYEAAIGYAFYLLEAARRELEGG